MCSQLHIEIISSSTIFTHNAIIDIHNLIMDSELENHFAIYNSHPLWRAKSE